MKYLFILTTVLYSFLAINGKAQSKNNKEIDNYIAKIQKQYNIPGLALAVIKNGEIIHKNNYGLSNIELSVPVTDKTLFPLFV